MSSRSQDNRNVGQNDQRHDQNRQSEQQVPRTQQQTLNLFPEAPQVAENQPQPIRQVLQRQQQTSERFLQHQRQVNERLLLRQHEIELKLPLVPTALPTENNRATQEQEGGNAPAVENGMAATYLQLKQLADEASNLTNILNLHFPILERIAQRGPNDVRMRNSMASAYGEIPSLFTYFKKLKTFKSSHLLVSVRTESYPTRLTAMGSSRTSLPSWSSAII